MRFAGSRPVTPTMITSIGQQIMTLRRKSLSLRCISRQLGCSKATVSKYIALVPEVSADDIKASVRAAFAAQSMASIAARMQTQTRTTGSGDASGRNAVATKAYFVHLGGGRCQICKYKRCIRALTFHHVDPSKKEIRFSRVMRYSLQRLANELSKCVLLCHNCHAEVHEGLHAHRKFRTIKVPQNLPESVVRWYRNHLGVIGSKLAKAA